MLHPRLCLDFGYAMQEARRKGEQCARQSHTVYFTRGPADAIKSFGAIQRPNALAQRHTLFGRDLQLRFAMGSRQPVAAGVVGNHRTPLMLSGVTSGRLAG